MSRRCRQVRQQAALRAAEQDPEREEQAPAAAARASDPCRTPTRLHLHRQMRSRQDAGDGSTRAQPQPPRSTRPSTASTLAGPRPRRSLAQRCRAEQARPLERSWPERSRRLSPFPVSAVQSRRDQAASMPAPGASTAPSEAPAPARREHRGAERGQQSERQVQEWPKRLSNASSNGFPCPSKRAPPTDRHDGSRFR